MNIIYSGKTSGKTLKLIEMCAATEGGYIVCRNREHAERIERMAFNRGLQIPYPMTFHESRSAALLPFLNPRIKALFIDDADDFMRSFFGQPIRAITLTDYEHPNLK